MASENRSYQQKCDLLTNQAEIRFAGFLDYGKSTCWKLPKGCGSTKRRRGKEKIFIETRIWTLKLLPKKF